MQLYPIPLLSSCLHAIKTISELQELVLLVRLTVRTKGYSTDLLDPTQVESKKSSQIQWPVPSINAKPVDVFLGEVQKTLA